MRILQKSKNILNRITNPTYMYQLSGQLSSQLLGFLLGVFLVRFSGVEILGGYNSLLAVMNMSIGIISSGILTNYLRNGFVEDYFLAFTTTIISTLLVFVFLLPIFLFIDYHFWDIVLIYGVTLFMSFIQISVYSLRLRKQDKRVLLPSILPVGLLISGLLLLKPDSLFDFLTLALLAWSVSVFFVWNDLRRISFRLNDIKNIFNYANASKLLIGTTIMTQIYGNLDLVLIKNLMSDEAVGLYKIAISLTMFAMPSIGIFSFIYLSEVKGYIERNDFNNLIQKRKRQFGLILFITILFVIFSVAFNRYIIVLVFKINSSEVISASVVLSFSVLFNALAMVNSYTLISIGKEKRIFKVLIFATIINAILNIVLIIFFGIVGAAFANTLTQVFIFVYNNFIVENEIRKLSLKKN